MMGRRKLRARPGGRPDPKQRCKSGAEDPRQGRRARREEGRSPRLPEEGREGGRGPRGGALALGERHARGRLGPLRQGPEEGAEEAQQEVRPQGWQLRPELRDQQERRLQSPQGLVGGLEPAPGVEVSPLGHEGRLYAHAGQQIPRLNAPAALVWRGIRRGRAVERVTATFARRFGAPPAEAAHCVASLLRDWRTRGWLVPARARAPRRFADSRRYRLLGTTFRVRCATREQAALVRPALAHLAVARGAAPDIALDLVSDAAGHSVLEHA